MTEEQVDKGSTDAEPRVIAEGGMRKTLGEVSKGTSIEGLMDDDR